MSQNTFKRGSCASRIAWSKTGPIAYITDKGVQICSLYCSDGEKWELSKPFTLTQVPIVHGGVPIVHLSFSPGNTSLACIDSRGQLSIWMVSVASSDVTCVYSPPSEALTSTNEMELNSIIGFSWLDPSKTIVLADRTTIQPNPEHTEGLRNRSISTYSITTANVLGPRHPLPNKYAAVAFTRRGVLKLFSQNTSGNKFYENSKALCPGENAVFLIASFGEWRDESFLLAGTVIGTGEVRLWSVSIDWNTNPPANQPHENIPTNPGNLVAKRVTSESFGAPSPIYELTHIHCMSSRQSDTCDMEIWMIWSGSDNTSIIKRYDLLKSETDLHESFYSLNLQNGAADQSISVSRDNERSFSLKEERIIEDKTVLNITSHLYDTFVNVCYSDGTIETTYREQEPTGNIKGILTLQEVGFAHSPGEIGSEICLSPSLLSFVSLNNEGSLSFHHIKYTASYDANSLYSVAVAFALRHAVACFSSILCDDIFILFQEFIKELETSAPHYKDEFVWVLLEEAHKSINYNLDIPVDHPVEKVMMNTSLQRLFSLQASVFTKKNFYYPIAGRIAMCYLNLRLLTFALTFTLRAASQVRPNIPDNELKAGHIHANTGFARWCTDFLVFICKELFEASQTPNCSLYDENNESLPMTIILSKPSRMFLIFSLRGIRGLEQIALRASQNEEATPGASMAARTAYRRFKDVISNTPVPLAPIEKLLNDVDNALKNIYPNLPDRRKLEYQLVFEGKIPHEFSPIAKRICDAWTKNIKPEVNIPKLYFHDVSWLGLDDSGFASLAKKSTNYFFLPEEESGKIKTDFLRKFIINHDSKLRSCTRCKGLSVYDDAKALSLSYWSVANQRSCLCGGSWIADASKHNAK
ncbi:hypothetical protein NADFUDRAFT_66043 [Nadsonia fulvescens var. elongata DSM 6958]|uniref:Mediator of RNA polymerase II transcription subunit 16 n=1 Tax=Nadsonia fulvescens var. elongata DSM 6958 TaxID=857566 RepID=A0A1E3PHM4_9ASCO|nr:hypothetical protein NADFUDRAFT_66043 [Nadsonia fulvescens var. elongata DSM 6958]